MIVLLHGAGTGSWVWERVIRELATPAAALDVQGRRAGATPDGCAAQLVGELDRKGVESIVLVVHSLAGVLVPALAARLGSRLRNAIFMAAVVPPSGGAFVDALSLPNRLILRALFRLNRGGLKPSAAMIRRELCNDLDEQDAELVVSRYEAELPGLYLTPTGTWPSLPACAYIKLRKDRSVIPSQQDQMIARLGTHRVHEIAAGHLAMLSAPAELARVLEQEASFA